MQDSASGGGGISHELSRASGLARFRSAPATWLDALLEDDDSLKLSVPHHHQGGLTQLLTSGTATNTIGPISGSNSGPSSIRPAQQQPAYNISADPAYFEESSNNTAAFQRMNSSPAEFLSANIEGYFSNFGGISTSYDFVDASPSSGSKRVRESDNTDQLSPNFSAQRRGEQSGQLSTANSLVELEMEKLLEDSVPCRVRAKRGCATHPRSIAERVRRTRISDRIRKLQELVPNMDKQTNTADMLEEAVEYVKTLQRQIQELTEQQKNCTCMAKS